MRYGAYHDGDLHVSHVAASLLLRLHEESDDPEIRAECFSWKELRDDGKDILVKYNNKLLEFNDKILRELAGIYERSADKKKALTITGCTGLPTIVR